MTRSYREVCFYIGLSTMLLGLAQARTVIAGSYIYEVPDLLGVYPNLIEVELELGTLFSSIDNATLQLTGTQIVGATGDLNSSDIFPYPAQIYAGFDGRDPHISFAAASVLPAINGPFNFVEDFEFGLLSEMSFAPWLDGVAEFTFFASGAIFAGGFIISEPTTSISSASIVIHGRILGDFDDDGDVDETDLARWVGQFGRPGSDADGAGFFSWQRQLGTSVPSPGVSLTVPEPTCIQLALFLGWIAFFRTAGLAGDRSA